MPLQIVQQFHTPSYGITANEGRELVLPKYIGILKKEAPDLLLKVPVCTPSSVMIHFFY